MCMKAPIDSLYADWKFSVWNIEIVMIIYASIDQFFEHKFTRKILKLATQIKHINIGMCAKFFGMSASDI